MDIRLFLEEIARGAGEITLKYFNNPELEVITKSDDSPVTRADRESEQYLRQRIREHFPNDVIIGEEYGTDGTNDARKWILDPIDGTKSFIHGVPLYGVLIGVEENGDIAHGVIFIPPLNEMVSASRGKGAYFNGRPCRVSSIANITESLVLTTDERRLRSMISASKYDKVVGSAKIFRTWGDCYGHLLVATGRADIMLDPKMAIWDIAPLGIIVEEAGGMAFSLSGTRTVYEGSLISCNSAVGESVRSILMASDA